MDDEYNIHDKLLTVLRDSSASPCDIPLLYLRDITNNFSEDRELGNGGFGVVYKGVLPNGEMVAVKNLLSMSHCQEKQFKNEVDNLMRVRHKHIVQFVGYCYEIQQKYTKYNGINVFAEMPKRLLCFEYMPNGSLEKYISDESCGLDWHQRYKIIKGICCGLHYLHNECQINGSVVHLDLKPENILLDDNMVPKIADFGLAKLLDDRKTQTCASSLVGSQGYMAPEYILESIISPMADIYSLGAIILQIITGRKFGPSGTETFCGDFVEQVLQNWRTRLEANPRHTSLETDYQQIDNCLEIGISCIQFDRRKRPNIKEIINKLDRWESTHCYSKDEGRPHANQIICKPKELLEINPLELYFSLEINQRVPCLVKLTNKTDDNVAFYLRVTKAKSKYNIEPIGGVLMPRSTCNVVVSATMEQQGESPWCLPCNDELLVQGITVWGYSAMFKPITADMFNNVSSSMVHKVKLKVVYVPSLSIITSEMQKEGYHVGLENFQSLLTSFTRHSRLRVIWELRDEDLSQSAKTVTSIQFDSDAERFATAGVSKLIKVFEFSSVINESSDVSCPAAEMATRSKISCLSWNKCSKNIIASSDYDGIVTVWDVQTHQRVEYKEHEKRTWSVDFSPTEPSTLISGGDDCKVKVWCTKQEASVIDIDMKASICSVEYNPGASNYVAVGSADHMIYYFDLRNPSSPVHIFCGHKKEVSYVKFLSNNELASASTDSTLRLWDVKDNYLVRTFRGHANVRYFGGLSANDEYLACGSETNEVYVYHKATSRPVAIHRFRSPDLDDDGNNDDDDGDGDDDASYFISAVCWKKDSPTLLTANSRGTIKVLAFAP